MHPICRAIFVSPAGQETGCDCLATAKEETLLRLEAESGRCHPGEMVYLRLRYTDENGEIKPLERGKITLEAEGAQVVGTANGCTYFQGNYAQSAVKTYFGEAQAVVRPDKPGRVLITATDGERTAQAELICEENEG